MTLVYDTGALLAAERGDRTMWALHRRGLDRAGQAVVPAVVLGGHGEVDRSRSSASC